MLAQEVAKKYSSALFDSAKGKGILDAVHTDLKDIDTLIQKDASFLTFLTSPNVLETNKVEVVRNIFGPRVQRLLVEFLVVLIEKKRISYFPEVIDEFTRSVEAEQGIGRATVITAVRIDDAQRSKLLEKLAAKTGLKIVLEEKIDKSIIGGMIIVLHNEIIDGSVRRGLDKIEDQLDRVRVH